MPKPHCWPSSSSLEALMIPDHSLFTGARGSQTGQSAYNFLSLWLVLSSAAESPSGHP